MNDRVKETHDKTQKGRIDYALGISSLASAISDVSHIFNEYELTDHATYLFSNYFYPADKEPVVFRAHPSLLKHPSYKCLIDNTIKYLLLNDLRDKSCKFYNINLYLLNEKISLQEEI